MPKISAQSVLITWEASVISRKVEMDSVTDILNNVLDVSLINNRSYMERCRIKCFNQDKLDLQYFQNFHLKMTSNIQNLT